MKPWLLSAIVLLAICAVQPAFAGSSENPYYVGMKWHKSVGDALAWSKSEHGPVMVVVPRPNDTGDAKAIDKLATWPQSVQLSQNKMAAVRLKGGSPEGPELLGKVNLKAPGIVFLDEYGNPLAGQPIPDTVQPIAAVVNGWPAVSKNIDSFVKGQVARGERFLGKGKLKDAYLEYSTVSPFKGPDGDQARSGKGSIERKWVELLGLALKQPAESVARKAIFAGLRRDTFATDFQDDMEQAIAGGRLPSVAGERVAAAGRKPGPAAAKSLVELAKSSPSTAARASSDGDEASLDSKFLLRSSDAKLKEVDALLQDGHAAFKKAIADGTDRGPARNELLKSAHAKFQRTLEILEEALKTKPDGQIEKLMERTSMLMYGCLKYQSL